MLLMLFLTVAPVKNTGAQEIYYPFTSKQHEIRFEHLIHQIRCLVCKNQTIAESNAGLAKDLRKKIHEQIHAGYSDKEIQIYLANRYGDFILFDPTFNPLTYLLWLAPIFVLIFGVCFLFYELYKRKQK